MGATWWPNGARFPASLADIGTMHYCDFEHFVVGVLRCYYSREDIQILGGKCRADGGRDGEGELLIGDALIAPELQGRFRIWLEAKHWSRSVDPNTTLGHVAAAFIAGVSKVVFVSSRRFSAGAREGAARFSRKTGLDCTFLDGLRLLDVAAALGLPEAAVPPRSKETTDLAVTAHQRSTAVDGRQVARVNTVKMEEAVRLCGQFLYNQWQSAESETEPKSLTLPVGEPLFLSVSVDVGLLPKVEHAKFELFPPSGWTWARLNTHRVVSLAAGDHIPFLFALLPTNEADVRVDGFAMKLACRGGTVITLPIIGQQRCRIVPRPLKEVLSPEQATAETHASSLWHRWAENPTVASFLFQAAQGCGKSFLLRRLRGMWLQRGHTEILLDCENCRTPEDLLLALFAKIFPVEPGQLSAANKSLVANWFETSGLESEVSHGFAESLCTAGKIPSTIGARLKADIVVTLLTQLAGRQPSVLVVDDLHKAAGSVIALLREVLIELSQRKISPLLVMTSRFVATHTDAGDLSQWADEMRALCAEGSVQTLSFAGGNEAWAATVLRSTFAELSDDDCRGIFGQVGCDPFNLTEAIRCLMGPQGLDRAPAITYEPLLGRLAVVDPAALHDRIADGSLRTATVTRLLNVIRILPAWAPKALQAAALLGRQFEYSQVHSMVQVDDQEFDDVFGILEREGICAGSAFTDSGELRFSHDLVRRAVLEIFARRENLSGLRRIAARLLDAPDESERSIRLRPGLAYASGRLASFLGAATEFATDAAHRGRPGDAVPMLLRAIECIDPSRLPPPFQYGREPRALDDVLAVLPPPIDTSRSFQGDRERRLLSFLKSLIEHSSVITSGSAEVIERAANEALVIAEVLGDHGQRIRLLSKLGKMWVERGAPDKALQMHALAEGELQILDEPLPAAERADMLVAHAIALRLMGGMTESETKLSNAMHLAGEHEPQIRRQVLSNQGALYFYTDPVLRRRYWTDALEVAVRAEDRSGAVHAALDLATIDILEDKYADATERANKALHESEECGYDNSLIRASIVMGALKLIDGRTELAIRHFRRAEGLAVLHSVDRRLWKARANMATAYELMDRQDLSYLEDRKVLDRIPDLSIALSRPDQATRERRVTVVLGNIALRAQTSAPHRQLLSELTDQQRRVADSLAASADTICRGDVSGFPNEHCKRLSHLIRYVVT